MYYSLKELHKQEILFLPYFNPQDEYQNKMPLECKFSYFSFFIVQICNCKSLLDPIWSEVEKKYKYSPTLLPSKNRSDSSEEQGNNGISEEEINNYSNTNGQ